MNSQKQLTSDEARRIGDSLSIDWRHIYLEQFRMGLLMALEYETREIKANATNDDSNPIGKIAPAHLKELPNYFTRLATSKIKADKQWAKK